MVNLGLNIGYYDPLSIFQGGFREDFISRTELPQLTFKVPMNQSPLQIKNLHLNCIEELPVNLSNTCPYLKFMFILAQNIDDYRSTARPLITQWIKSVKDLNPRIPLFIFLFETAQAKLATDKLLKTSIESKLKKDFPQTEYLDLNIFRIKSVYHSSDEKLALWTSLKEKIKTALGQSILNKLEYFTDDECNKARIYTELEMYQQATTCYEKLFLDIDYISLNQGFEEFDLSDPKGIFDPITFRNSYQNKFDEKIAYFKYQAFILLNPSLTPIQKNKNISNLISLILNLINTLEMCPKRHEFAWILISQFFQLPDIEALVPIASEINNNQIEVQGCLTNLLLLKRNELMKLGKIKSYFIKGAFVDLLINEGEGGPIYELHDEELKSILESFKSFSSEIINESKDILQRYNLQGQNKHIAASLEAEISLIFHYNCSVLEDYSDDEPISYLYNSYQHFNKNGWDNISLPLLEVYIEHLEQKAISPKTSETDAESAVKNLLASYMNFVSLKPISFRQQKLNEYLDLFFKNSRKDTKSGFIVNAPSILDCVDIDSLYCVDVDTYALDVNLKTSIEGLIVNDVVIELSATDDTNTILYFTWNADNLEPLNLNTKFTVTSSVFVKGLYRVSNIFATIGTKDDFNVTISHEYPEENGERVFIYNIESFILNNKLVRNTQADICIPQTRWLHKDVLEFSVKFGDFKYDVKDCVFTFFKVEPDRVVSECDYQLFLKEEKLDFEFDDYEDKIVFNTHQTIFKAGDHLKLLIPFFFPADITNTKLSLYYAFEYTLLNDEHLAVIQYNTSSLSTHLNIAASADERIQQDSLISHFTLNSILPNFPICIHNVSLEAKKSKVEEWMIPKDVIVFMDQGSTFFFRIKELNDKEVNLKIEYNCLWTEIVEFVAQSFEKRLSTSEADSDLVKYGAILKDIWREIEFKVNYYALTGHICANDFDIRKFEPKLEVIKGSDKIRLETQIVDHINNLLDLSKETTKEQFSSIRASLAQALWIPVQLPKIDIIATLEYKYERELQYLVGEPISTRVHLNIDLFEKNRARFSNNEHINFLATSSDDNATALDNERKVRFDDSNNLKTDHKKSIMINLDFVEDDQSWLIAGVKDMVIEMASTTAQSRKYDFDLVFVPLKTGKLGFPVMNLGLPNGSKLALHLDYKNKGEIITVVTEMNTLTQIH